MRKKIICDKIEELTADECIKKFDKLILKECRRYSYDIEDMHQHGRIALWKAYKDYDYKNGNKFITIATVYVKNELRRYNEYMHQKFRNRVNETLDKTLTEDTGRELKLEDIIEDYRYYGSNREQETASIVDEMLNYVQKSKLLYNEKKFFNLLLQDYTVREAAEKLGYKRENGYRIKNKIFELLRKEYEVNV